MADLVTQLVERYFSTVDGELRIGELPVSELTRRFGAPLFVYDGAVLAHKLSLLRSVLPERFTVCYSVKANPTQAILRFFLAERCGLEIASGGEFHQALAAGCPAVRIIFAGPGKSEAELEYVLRHGIGEIHIESLTEAARVSAICARLGVRAPVAVRINPSADAEGGAMRMGGKPAPFGIDEELLDEVLNVALSDPNLDFRGIHVYAGTQILDHTILLSQYRKGIEIARRVAGRIGRPLHTLDFGGGLGIPYFASDAELDAKQLGQGLRSLWAEIVNDACFSGTHFVVEPGRYLVGEAGVYISRVNDIKSSRGKKFLIVDGGMNHHLAASGNLGQTIKRNFPMAVLNRIALPAEETVDVVGPLCTPLDVLARAINLPKAEVGDLIGVFQSGAYARTASPLGFLSHPAPAEVLVNGKRAELIRRRGEYADYLCDVCIPLSNTASASDGRGC